MLVTKSNPAGVDWIIQSVQTRLHDALLQKWGITSDQYQCYGRCYRNKTDSGFVAQWFTGGIDYREAFWDDNLSAVSFFGESDKVEIEKGLAKAPVHLVMFVNLSKIKPLIAHRADEEVRVDALQILSQISEVQSVETGMDNVLREYPGTRKTELAVRGDMHPVSCFRINLLLNYHPLQCSGARF
jgi:hypothetical protein